MDLIIRQATELGIYRIIPLLAERSTVKVNAANSAQKLERWQRVSVAAAEQSGLLQLPEILPAQSLDDAMQLIKGCTPKICAWEEASAGSLRQTVAAQPLDENNGAAVIIGPEGGFTTTEVKTMQQAGCSVITLGQTVLRTETAATVTTALLLQELGGLS
jgi:16S rRNA (uracil1498-N3)-methyltransferase